MDGDAREKEIHLRRDMITCIVNVRSEKSLQHVNTERTLIESGHNELNLTLACPVRNNDRERVFAVG